MDDKERSRRVSSGASKSYKSYKSSSINSEFGLEYRVELEDKYLQNCLEFRPPSGTNHQQPGSHLSVDTRLSELSLGESEPFNKVTSLSRTTTASSEYRGAKHASSKNRDPHRIQVDKPNCYISSPFKQGYQTPKKESYQVVDPGHELKSVTKETIAKVRQQFRRPKPPCQPSPYSQRLRKAKFKSTGRPISGSGPSIRQCQGVQAGHRVVHRTQQPLVYYEGDQSRLYSHSNRPDSPTELLRANSSIHCTSRASSKADSNEESSSEGSLDNCKVDTWMRHSHVQNEEVSDNLLSGDRDEHFYRDHDVVIPHGRDVLLDTLVQTNRDSREKDRRPNELDIENTNLTNKEKEIGNKNDNKKERKVRCKPFSDGRVDPKDDDDENTENLYDNRVFSCQGNSSHARPQTDSTGPSVHNDGSKEKGTLAETTEELQRSFESVKNIQLQNDKEKKFYRENENQLVNKPVAGRDRCLHIVDSSAGDTSPVMRVHVRGKLENDTPSGTGLQDEYKTAMSDIQEKFINKDVDDDNDDDYDDYIDYDDLDSDRIPSAEIWKNLGHLNLSTNDYHNTSMSVHSTGFPLKARKVHSAGANRKQTIINPNYAELNVQRMKQADRTSRSKQKTHSKKSENVDKVEIMRKYLLEESKRFSAELRSKLPGYFTEQFNIIQNEKSGLNIETPVTVIRDSNELLATAAVKSGGEEEKQEEKKLDEPSNENNGISDSTFEVADGVESDQVYSDILDPTLSGVFFTVETTSSCTMESVSGRTEDTVGNESWNEFSDDTGFDTMPGKGVPGDLSDDDKSPFKSDCRQEQVNIIQPEELEIVAKAKILTDSKLTHKKYAICPYEPLTFDINARPPAGYVFYFAYGVDMNIKRMSIYLRGEHKRLWGVLFGFELRFNKKGSSTDAGGFANIEFSPGSSVEGCVYTITDAELSMLDNCMGYPKHYTRAVLPVWMCNCHEPSLHGVAQYCVPAVLYVAEQRWIQPGPADTLDYRYSVSQCLKATDILTPNYVDFLQELAANSAKSVVLA